MLLTALACDKDDDPGKFTSINGYWIVRTPDDATNVTFRVIQDADKLHTISNVAVRHNGVDYNSKQIEGGLTVVSAREIESITMFNNSFIAPFFVIRFQEISVYADFTEMQINISNFSLDGTFREFSSIIATRN